MHGTRVELFGWWHAKVLPLHLRHLVEAGAAARLRRCGLLPSLLPGLPRSLGRNPESVLGWRYLRSACHQGAKKNHLYPN